MDNREIKVRVWNKKIKQFLSFHSPSFDYNDGIGMYLVPDKDYSSLDFDFIEDDFIIQQFTGFKDINDKEIYEGDILYLEDNDEYFQICWCNNIGGWTKLGSEEEYTMDDYSDSMRIVGNVFENPELLTTAKK